MAFPQSLDFSLKKNAVATRMMNQVHYPISSSSASPLDVVTFNLSAGRYGSYIDPSSIYLSFTFNNADGVNATTIDHTAYSVIDRAVVMSSGQVISDLQNYGAWAAMVLDSQVGVGKPGFMSTFAGSATSTTLNSVRAGLTVPANSSVPISLPLMGTAIDSSSCDKMIPVGALGDLQLQLYIADKNNAIYGAAAGNWTLSAVALTVGYVQLDAGAQKLIDEAQGGEYMWSAELYKSYNYNLAAASGSDNVVVPFKGSSLKSVYAIYRYARNIANNLFQTQSSRVCPFVNGSTFFSTIGSDTYPQIPIKNSTQHAMEFLKSWHTLGSPLGLHTSLDASTYSINVDPQSAAAVTGSFIAALNLECYSNKSNTIHSGVNVVGGTTLTLNQVYNNGAGVAALPTPATGTILQTTFTHYDAILSIKDGQLSVAF